MTRPATTEDRRLVRCSRICLSLPEATRSYNGEHAAFLVRKKTFAYYFDNHHRLVAPRSLAARIDAPRPMIGGG